MTNQTIPKRSEVPEEMTWNLNHYRNRKRRHDNDV